MKFLEDSPDLSDEFLFQDTGGLYERAPLAFRKRDPHSLYHNGHRLKSVPDRLRLSDSPSRTTFQLSNDSQHRHS